MKTQNQARARLVDWRVSLLWALVALAGVYLLLGLALPGRALAQSAARVDVATLNTTVDMFTVGYVQRVLGVAQQDGAQALIIQMDTPGGDLEATRALVQSMLASPVPVVVYISPSGARAGSAGTFITYAANVAAMAPVTNIGAAHPVGPNGEDITGTEGIKITNDAAALIRTVAERRGRNADWAEKAVRESVSLTEKEALDQHVVDIVARDMNDLLNQLDGRTVDANGSQVTLHTRGAVIHPLDMTVFEQALHILFDPSVVAILLTLGSLALIAEIFNPGAILPGVTGVICLILAGVALFNLPTNWASVLLIIASIIMFVVDLKVNSFFLTLGGIVAFVLGALFLFRPFTPPEPDVPQVTVSPYVIAAMALLTTGFFVFALRAAVRSRKLPVITGMSPYLGARGVATSELNPEGTVRVRSEEWTAQTETPPIHTGERVQVVGIEGIRFHVARITPENPEK
ncbi:MAG: nodulation protein NfeD [Anaerolineae bacterium]